MRRFQCRMFAPLVAAAVPRRASSTDVDASKITKANVWSLWNDGNLFCLSLKELSAFLQQEGQTVDPAAKKSALVRSVEQLMSTEMPQTTAQEDTVSNITSGETAAARDEAASTRYAGTDLFEQADVYGDWGAEQGFEERKSVDYMATTPQGLRDAEQVRPTATRAFQLLHADVSANVGLASIDATALPGCKHLKNVFTPVAMPVDDANKLAFRRGFQWSVANMWNLGLEGEVNIGAGKALYRRSVAKHNRSVLPQWTCQTHLHVTHPYTWFAVAHESNTQVMEGLATKLGMTSAGDVETSYKVEIKRSRDFLDVEANKHLEITHVGKPWDRLLCTHYLRPTMPDLRYLVRARRPLKKRVADAYFEQPILKHGDDRIVSGLDAELGEVKYVCERQKRVWSTRLDNGVKLQLVETKRTPLIVITQGEEGSDRLEYELIASIPQQVERVDLKGLADDLWVKGTEFATLLEDGMLELQGHTMPSSAAFN